MRGSLVVLPLLAGLIGLMAGCSGRVAIDAAAEAAVGQAGSALWRGERPLVARIAGHTSPLPPQAARCINCHGQAEATRSDAPIPVLTASHLRQATARRGGPSSRYDAATFCQVLRSGVDPAAVLLPRAMPRYEIGEADCTALWQYLTLKDTNQ